VSRYAQLRERHWRMMVMKWFLSENHSNYFAEALDGKYRNLAISSLQRVSRNGRMRGNQHKHWVWT
jgi:hypothetical protein